MNDFMNDSMQKSICCYTTQMMMNLNYFVSFTNMWATHSDIRTDRAGYMRVHIKNIKSELKADCWAFIDVQWTALT